MKLTQTDNLDDIQTLRAGGTFECCDECGETILRDGTCPHCDDLDKENRDLDKIYKNI